MDEYRLEMDLVCVLILFWIVSKIRKEKDEQTSLRVFLWLVNSLIIFSIFDVFCEVSSYFNNTFAYVTHQLSAMGYYIFLGGSCFLWLVYSASFTKNKKLYNKSNKWSYRLPLLIYFLLVIVSPFTGLIYRIDPLTNVLSNGYIFFANYIIIYLYIIVSAAQLIIAFIFDSETKVDLTVETVVAYLILPLLSLIADMFSKISTSSMIPAFTLIFAATFFDRQIGATSTDGLTGLNNKRQYLQYVSNVMNEPESHLKMFLFMVDVDYLKKINDKYSHAEGDKIIIEVSKILKRICGGSQGMFLARYGGDEFVFVIKARFVEEVESLKKELQKAVIERNEDKNTVIPLSLSIGYAKYEKDKDTLDTLTARADEMLYKEKELHHKMLDNISLKSMA